MRRASLVLSRTRLVRVAALAAVAALVGLAGACDSSLNLGDGAGDAEAGTTVALEGGTPTCATTCDRVIACGYGQAEKREACLTECAQKARPADLDCIARTACPDIFRVCSGLPADGSIPNPFDPSAFERQSAIESCQSACDRFQFFDCLNAAELSTCRGLCETVADAKRSSFNACASGAGSNCPKSLDCFAVLQK